MVLDIEYYHRVEEWPLWMREAFHNFILLYSKDSNYSKESIRDHISPSKEELTYFSTELVLDLAWHGIHIKDKVEYGTPYDLPDYRFLERRSGEIGSTIYINSALIQILKLFYFANGQFPPTEKWLIFQFPDYSKIINSSISTFLNSPSINIKVKELTFLLELGIEA